MNPQVTAEIAGALWLLAVVVWIVSAFGAKRTTQRNYSSWVFRIVVVVIVFFFVQSDPTSYSQMYWGPSYSMTLDVVGLLLIVAGIAIAFWARFYLGRNWGMPMSHKENPELVTTGPYAYIRNPIYTGILLAMLGSGWVLGVWWFLVAACALVYFLYASLQEEKIMTATFPAAYPAYKARTKMLIPWIL